MTLWSIVIILVLPHYFHSFIHLLCLIENETVNLWLQQECLLASTYCGLGCYVLRLVHMIPGSFSAAGMFVSWGWGRDSETPNDSFQVWFLWTGRILKTFCCTEDSFSIVPVGSLGKSLQAGGETSCCRGYLEDWKRSHCSSSACS